MIKVLQVVDKLSMEGATIHGVTRLFSWWIPHFDKTRFNVSICNLRKRDKAGELLEKTGIQVFYLNRGKFDPLTLIDLLKMVGREQIDILHLHGYGSTTFGRICGALKNIPCILHEHMYDSNIPIYQRIADILLSRLTTHAIAVSESVKDFFVCLRGVPANKVQVIYNGVPLEVYDTLKSSSGAKQGPTWKERLNIPSNHKLIGIIGRLNVIKGHSYFLEAAQMVLKNFNEVTFLVVGDGDLMSALSEKCKNLKIDKNVIFAGYCKEVPSLLSEIDIKVIASLSEGVPLTLFEAMAAGCAIVSTNVGGLGEVIEEGKTGYLVPPANARALAEKILLLLKNPEFCQAMGLKAQETSHKFDIRNTVRQLEACYMDVLGQC